MLEEIQQPIAAELERYKALFRAALHSDNELLSAALSHLTRKLGKMMRPTLVILCAREGGRVTDEVLHAAAGLEMLHTASLVHDDVVDESMMRRGQRMASSATTMLPLKKAFRPVSYGSTGCIWCLRSWP